MELKQRHIEVIMKGFALCLTGMALLAAGCAQNRNLEPEIAPSRQASRLTSGSGWSVPPGQHRVTGPAAVRGPSQDERALTARSEKSLKGTTAPKQTVGRDSNPRRDGNQPARTMRRESGPRGDPSNLRTAGRRTPAAGQPPAAPVAGRERTPKPRNRARLDAGKGEAAGGKADPGGVERAAMGERGVESRVESKEESRVESGAVTPLVKSRGEQPAFDNNPDPRNGTQSPGREKVADPTRPGRLKAARPLRETAARVDGQFRRHGTEQPIRRVKPLVRAIPVRAVRKESTALRTVHFDFDSHKLSAEAEGVLNANARWLLDHPRIMVRVEGHADERGTSEYNLTLGAHRARKVRDFLISRGVAPETSSPSASGRNCPWKPGPTRIPGKRTGARNSAWSMAGTWRR